MLNLPGANNPMAMHNLHANSHPLTYMIPGMMMPSTTVAAASAASQNGGVPMRMNSNNQSISNQPTTFQGDGGTPRQDGQLSSIVEL